MSQEERELIDCQRFGDESNTGFIIECDLQYQPELDDAHNDYPLAVERLDIQIELLSEIQVAIFRHYARSSPAKTFKLVPKLMPKKNNVVFYRNLKFYFEDWMRLRKIHRVMAFTQTR